MCDPVSLMIGSTVVSGIGGAAGMIGQAKNSEMQAKLADQQAEQERQSGIYQAGRLTDKLKRVGGQQRAAFAEGGLSGGSNFDVMTDTAEEGDLDVASVLWNSRTAVDNRKYEASVHRSNAKTSRMGAPFAFLSPILSGAAKYPSAFGMK